MPSSTKLLRKNMTEGKIFSPMLIFTLSVMATALLQKLYSTADIIVVGQFLGGDAVASIGATSSIEGLTIGLFFGLSMGAAVSVSHKYGARDYEEVGEYINTIFTLATVLGIVTGIFGFCTARTFLELMKTPDDIIDASTLYLKIVYIGIPGSFINNYAAATMRAMGDSKHPFIFFSISGLLNFVLNIISVAIFKMGVDGVAIATVISVYFSTFLIFRYFLKLKAPLNFDFKKMNLNKKRVMQILRYGVPSAIQSMMFSLSNVLIQSSINSFGTVAISANAAASNIEGFLNLACNSSHQAALTYVGQNIGAKKYDRIKKIVAYNLIIVTVTGMLFSYMSIFFGRPLLALFLPGDYEAIEAGMIRIIINGIPYFIFGLMDTMGGIMRGLGRSVFPTVVAFIGICVFRVVWIYTVFAAYPTLEVLYYSYPISWAMTFIAHFISFVFVFRGMLKRQEKQLKLSIDT